MYIGFLTRDNRMKTAAALAERKGHRTKTADRLGQAMSIIREADVLVLPIPVTRDGVLLSATDIPLAAITPKSGARLFGGGIPESLSARLRHHRMLDALKDEAFAQRNARLTAEGGIHIALGATERGFYGLSAAVFGFGRIGKQVAGLLHGFHVPVTVLARRAEVLAEAEAFGYRTHLLRPPLRIEDALIFGTIPAPIYADVHVTGEAIAVDLGGGMPPTLSHGEGETPVISARGVPGVFAPRAAGEAVYTSLSVLLEESP